MTSPTASGLPLSAEQISELEVFLLNNDPKAAKEWALKTFDSTEDLVGQKLGQTLCAQARLAITLREERDALPPLDKELIWILGRPGFAVIGIARTLQAAGVFSEHHFEEEQANVIYWMLQHYLKQGADKWRGIAGADLAAMKDKLALAQSADAKGGG